MVKVKVSKKTTSVSFCPHEHLVALADNTLINQERMSLKMIKKIRLVVKHKQVQV